MEFGVENGLDAHGPQGRCGFFAMRCAARSCGPLSGLFSGDLEDPCKSVVRHGYYPYCVGPGVVWFLQQRAFRGTDDVCVISMIPIRFPVLINGRRMIPLCARGTSRISKYPSHRPKPRHRRSMFAILAWSQLTSLPRLPFDRCLISIIPNRMYLHGICVDHDQGFGLTGKQAASRKAFCYPGAFAELPSGIEGRVIQVVGSRMLYTIIRCR